MNIDVTISIHALLAESDYSMGRNEKSFRGYFYPRSPCGERLRGWTLNINGPIFLSTLSLRRATPTQQRKTKTNEFLSTLSLRRATGILVFCGPQGSDFYPRSPCGERPLVQIIMSGYARISIHALLAESDAKRLCNALEHLHFYPRSPCGERPAVTRVARTPTIISIHALLAESDIALLTPPTRKPDFYPRSPCGERPHNTKNNCIDCCISIHALLAESDSKSAQNNGALLHI